MLNVQKLFHRVIPCINNGVPFKGDSAILHQSRPFPDLINGGYYDKGPTLRSLREKGTCGLGAFRGFRRGEGLLLGGVFLGVSRSPDFGPQHMEVLREEDLEEQTPFFMAVDFKPGHFFYCKQVTLVDLQAMVREKYGASGNYALMVYGDAECMAVRQTPSMDPESQGAIDLNSIPSVIVPGGQAVWFGVCLAANVDLRINVPDIHMHGVIQKGDVLVGGHLAGGKMGAAVVYVQPLHPQIQLMSSHR